MKIKLSVKIIGIVLLLTTVLLSVLGFIEINEYSNSLRQVNVEKAKSIAYALDANIKSMEDLEEGNLMTYIQKQIWLNAEIIEIDVNVPDGRELVTIASNDNKKLNTLPDIDNYNAFRTDTIIEKNLYAGGDRKFRIITPIHSSGKTLGTYQIDISLEELDNRIYNKIIVTLIIYVAGLFIFSIVLFLFLNKEIVMPLLKINDGLKEVEKGNLDFSLSIQSKDELGEVAACFNSMHDNLKKTKEEMQKLNLSLEKTVSERTQDLNSKMLEMEKTKQAVLNILEDSDETNKDLSLAKNQLDEKIRQLQYIDLKKDEFLSVTAHELKTPLTSIKGFTDLLKNEQIMKNKVLRMKYFNIIIEDTARLGKLITDILDLSRLDMGTMKFNIEEASVDELATAVKDLCDMGIKEKNLKSVYDIGKGIPKIQTDKSRITQVISNLLNNSMKYTEKGSIRLEIFKKDEDVHFRVTDTGVGIPIEAQPRIFERFFQADSSYTRKVGGSGLGLSICKGIVEALGGRIWFTSSDKGTIFEFLIPVANKVAGKTQNINTLDASK